MPKYDISLIISLIAILISLSSAIFSYIRTKESTKITKLKQAEYSEKILDIISINVDSIKMGEKSEEIEKSALASVTDIHKSEVFIGKKNYKLLRRIIDPMWDAVRERQNYLDNGIGKIVMPRNVHPPNKKLSNLESSFLQISSAIRRNLSI